jgi:hypothetical protein
MAHLRGKGSGAIFKAIVLFSSAVAVTSLHSAGQHQRQQQQTETVTFLPSGHFSRNADSAQTVKASKSEPVAAKKTAVKQVALVASTHIEKSPAVAADVEKPSERSSLMRGLRGGLAGMLAAVLQVICLLWLRTAMNRQYFYGGTLHQSLVSLWTEGGIARFYSGVSIALLQTPLARFGDTFLQTATTAVLGMPGTTVHGGSIGMIVATLGAFWRLVIAPLDTLKVTMQVHGDSATKVFSHRVRTSGLLELWSGVSAMFLVHWVGSFPWWTVYNLFLEFWPVPASPTMLVLRNAIAGVVASMASDVASNSVRVLKIRRQATVEGSLGAEGYVIDARDVMRKDGTWGLFFRALSTRLVAGAIQGAFFSVSWNLLLGHITA